MSRRLTAIVVLVGVAIFINYIDRGNLATAATLVKKELRLSPSQLGFLLTAFFITYMPLQPVVGWLVDRFTASRVLVAGFFIWSAATTLSGFSQGFAGLFACRLLLGVGESVSFPSMCKILSDNVNEAQRGLANGIVNAGIAFGPAFGILVGGMVVAAFGWRDFFIVFGLASLAWILAWLTVSGKHLIHTNASQLPNAPATRVILREPSLWAASLAHFFSNFVLYFLVTWIPYYLVIERHWSLQQMAIIAGVAFSLFGASMVLFGAIADHLIRRGASPTVVRKASIGLGAAFASVGLLGCGFAYDAVSAAVWLTFACAAWGLLAPNTFTIPQTLAGPAATGRWIGIQNTVGNVAGIIAPALTGVLVERTGSFAVPFTLAAVCAFSSGATWLFLVGAVVPIDWPGRIAMSSSRTPLHRPASP